MVRLSGDQRRQFRRKVQLVFQNPFASLDPRRTIGQIVEEPLWNFETVPKPEREHRVRAMIERVGLPVNIRGLSLSAVESGLVEDGTNRFLVVEGDVTNIAKDKTKVPPIQVSVKDEAGQTLYSWTTEPPRNVLEPAELVRFRARLASPPEKGRSVQVRFTSVSATTNIASTH